MSEGLYLTLNYYNKVTFIFCIETSKQQEYLLQSAVREIDVRNLRAYSHQLHLNKIVVKI